MRSLTLLGVWTLVAIQGLILYSTFTVPTIKIEVNRNVSSQMGEQLKHVPKAKDILEV